jgi:hypothetical protein
MENNIPKEHQLTCEGCGEILDMRDVQSNSDLEKLKEENNRLKGLLWESWWENSNKPKEIEQIDIDFQKKKFNEWLDKQNIKL